MRRKDPQSLAVGPPRSRRPKLFKKSVGDREETEDVWTKEHLLEMEDFQRRMQAHDAETPTKRGQSLPPIPTRPLQEDAVGRFTSVQSMPALPTQSETEDFSGTWVMRRAEGDFDGFMKEAGVGWALRRAAGVAGFGVDRTFHHIEHTKGDREFFKVTTKNPKGTFVKECYIDGTEQGEIDPLDKKPITVVPSWDGNKFKLEAFCADRGPLPVTLRYMDGGEMVVEQRSVLGITVKRVFMRDRRHTE